MNDIDPEEVRRALKFYTPLMDTLMRAARAWLASLPPDTTTPDVQAQIDAAVADCEQRCATQLADYISRAADDERVRIDAAVAKEREECAKECERIVSGIGSATAAFPVRVCASQIRARSVKG